MYGLEQFSPLILWFSLLLVNIIFFYIHFLNISTISNQYHIHISINHIFSPILLTNQYCIFQFSKQKKNVSDSQLHQFSNLDSKLTLKTLQITSNKLFIQKLSPFKNVNCSLKVCNSIQNMERKDVIEAYGLRDIKKSIEQKEDSKVTQADEQQLSYEFQASLSESNPIKVLLCGRELTVKHLGMEQSFTLGFWATCQLIYEEARLIGFRLSINDYQSYELYSCDKLVLQEWKKAFQSIIVMEGFYQEFKPTVKIGKGKSASVFLAKGRFDQQNFAIKAFLKSQLQKDKKDIQGLENEVTILRSIEHANIIKIIGLYETEKSFYMVLQYIEGKTLKNFIEEEPILFSTCLNIIGKLAGGLKYLATKDIAHRDLKPDNIIINKENNPVILDFGLATHCKNTNYIFKHCGTPGFVAPEILQPHCHEYTPKVDVFSLGIIFHLLVFKKFPYTASDHKSLLEQNKKANFNFSSQNYQCLPKQTLLMLEGMLDANPNDRISARKIHKKLTFKHQLRENSKSQKNMAKSLSKRALSVKQNTLSRRTNRL